MRITCLRRGTPQTYENLAAARQHNGGVIIRPNTATSERLIPDAELVEAAADGEETVLIAEVDSSAVVTDIRTVRERDGTVRTWSGDVEQADVTPDVYHDRTISTVREISAV